MKFISHLTRAQLTPSAAATVQVSHALITILQCVYPGTHDTHQHGNQIRPRLRMPFPAATPSWKLAPRLRSKHENELLVAHEKHGQLPLLTVYVVPM